MNYRVVLGLVLLCFSTLALQADAQCAFPAVTTSGAWIGYVSDMRTCYNSVSLSSTTKSSTITALQNIVEMYSYTDLVTNSNLNSAASYDLSVNLRSQLSSISSTSYSTDYDFQMTLASLFLSLRDAHTTYTPPRPYQNSFVLFPFKITSVMLNGQQRIQLASKFYSNGLYESVYSRQIDQYVGKTVSTIDGVDAFTAVVNRANELHLSKDPAGRFNSALKDGFAQRSCSQARIPATNDFSITFTDGTSVTLPWMAIIARSYSTSTWNSDMIASADAMAASATSEETPLLASMESPEMLLRNSIIQNGIGELLKPNEQLQVENLNAVALEGLIAEHPEMESTYKSLVEAKKLESITHANRVVDSTPIKPVDSIKINNDVGGITQASLVTKAATSAGDTTYYLYNNAVPVLKLTTFAPNDGSSQPWMSSINVMKKVISDSAANNYENLIIDLQGNGGGYVCLAFGLIRALVSDFAKKARAYERYDLRRSTFSDSLINNGYTSPLAWNDASNYGTDNTALTTFQDTTWYTQGSSYTRGGLSSSYSKKNFMNCDAQGSGTFWFATPNNYFFKKIIIITDGLCGSACSLFATKLRYYNKATLVTVGGYAGQQMESSTFAGGSVFEYANIVSRARALGVNSVSYPYSSMGARVNWYEMYMGTQDLPREWIRVPGDVKLDTWDFTNLQAIYSAATPTFASMQPITNAYPYQPESSAAGLAPSLFLVFFALSAVFLATFADPY